MIEQKHDVNELNNELVDVLLTLDDDARYEYFKKGIEQKPKWVLNSIVSSARIGFFVALVGLTVVAVMLGWVATLIAFLVSGFMFIWSIDKKLSNYVDVITKDEYYYLCGLVGKELPKIKQYRGF